MEMPVYELIRDLLDRSRDEKPMHKEEVLLYVQMCKTARAEFEMIEQKIREAINGTGDSGRDSEETNT